MQSHFQIIFVVDHSVFKPAQHSILHMNFAISYGPWIHFLGKLNYPNGNISEVVPAGYLDSLFANREI